MVFCVLKKQVSNSPFKSSKSKSLLKFNDLVSPPVTRPKVRSNFGLSDHATIKVQQKDRVHLPTACFTVQKRDLRPNVVISQRGRYFYPPRHSSGHLRRQSLSLWSYCQDGFRLFTSPSIQNYPFKWAPMDEPNSKKIWLKDASVH